MATERPQAVATGGTRQSPAAQSDEQLGQARQLREAAGPTLRPLYAKDPSAAKRSPYHQKLNRMLNDIGSKAYSSAELDAALLELRGRQ